MNNHSILLRFCYKLVTPSILPTMKINRAQISLGCQMYSTATNTVTIDKNMLAKLRKDTGYPFNHCRKALLQNDNNFDKALEWLNEEAAKEGWTKSAQLQNRKAAQGLLGMICTDKQGVLVEVNCETDFVARNLRFMQLVSQLTTVCSEYLPELDMGNSWKKTLTSDEVSSIKTGDETIGDLVAKEIGSIKENVVVNRAVFAKMNNPNHFIGSYVHTAGVNQSCLTLDGTQFGKYASFVQIEGAQQNDMNTYGLQLGQHVVGMNPTSLGSMSEEAEETASTGEDDSEETPKRERSDDDESRLLSQEFLLEPDVTTREWLTERNLKVIDFIRLGVGEDKSS